MQALLALINFFFFFSLFSSATALVIRAPSSSSSIAPSSSSSKPPSSSAAPSTTVVSAAAASPSDAKPTFRAKARILSQPAGIRAIVDFTGYGDGRGTYVKVEVYEGLRSDDAQGNGPYSYHIHTNPVSADGNCTSTKGHLDPLTVTDAVTCNPDTPEYCEEGDLSGKHGKMNGTTDGTVNAFGYTDEFLRFFPEFNGETLLINCFPEELSILGRSIVIHDRNKTRIACGNITSILDGTADEASQPTNKASTYVTHYPDASTKANGTTVSIARAAIPLGEALFVKLTMVNATMLVNNTQTVVEVPTLVA
ncbi:hypothetical protein FRC00_012995, partial [Tulasnella sp. 408]